MNTPTILYKDILKEIEVLEMRIDELGNHYNALKKLMFRNKPKFLSAMDYSMDRVQTSSNDTPLDKIYEEMNKIEFTIDSLKDILENKVKAKQGIENTISQFESLEYKVAYMRDIEGKSLYEIAAELDYSYDWIKKISSRVSRKALKQHFSQ